MGYALSFYLKEKRSFECVNGRGSLTADEVALVYEVNNWVLISTHFKFIKERYSLTIKQSICITMKESFNFYGGIGNNIFSL